MAYSKKRLQVAEKRYGFMPENSWVPDPAIFRRKTKGLAGFRNRRGLYFETFTEDF